MIKKKCQYCGKNFKVHNYRKDEAKYCSRNCAYNSRKLKTQKLYKCDYCGNIFSAYKSMQESNKYHYCCNDCKHNHCKIRCSSGLSDQTKLKISLGKKRFDISKDFLIKEYANKELTTIKSVADIVGCANCTILKWLKKYNIKTKPSYKFLPTIKKSNTNDCEFEFKRYSEPAKKYYGKKCMICGYDKSIAVHHIVPKKFGGRSTLSNLIPLCPNCHQEAHLGLLKQELLFSVIHKVMKTKSDTHRNMG